MKRRLILLILLLVTTVCYAAQDVNVESLKVSHVTTVVNVTTVATPLPATPLSGRKVILVQNVSSSVVYLGNASVTANTLPTGGYQLRSIGDNWKGDFDDNIVVYGIVSAGTVPVLTWEAR